MTTTDREVVAGTPATTPGTATGWGGIDGAQSEHVGQITASADGDEPLGEAPEVTMPAAARLIDRQAQALNEIRAMHREAAMSLLDSNCGECLEPWPCRTVVIIDGLEQTP